jgi:hypothetical protein
MNKTKEYREVTLDYCESECKKQCDAYYRIVTKEGEDDLIKDIVILCKK